MKFWLMVAVIITGLLWGSKTCVWAEEMSMEARVVWIVEQGEKEVNGKVQPFQTLSVEIMTGPEKGKKVVVDYGKDEPLMYVDLFKVGDRIILGKSEANNETGYYIVDRVRTEALYWLMAIFVVVTLVVAKRQAIQSLIALVVSFVVIFYVVLPQVLAGTSPIVVSIMAAVVIIPTTFYLSHGWKQKTHVAVWGTLISLGITVLLSALFVSWTHLSGLVSEEASFLKFEQSFINVRGLLLAGMIIGLLGVLDDVTISQAAVVEELLRANATLTIKQLYSQAMTVGRDHIASMINTLVLVYAGAAMPLLLLFMTSPKPMAELINYEIVAEEIVRTLTGSVGLVLAVPITTLLAAYRFKRWQKA